MEPNVWWIIVPAVLVGHGGLNVVIYNRINATGMSRRTVKRLTKLFFAWTLIFPPLVLALHWDVVIDFLSGRPGHLEIPFWLIGYGLCCLASWLVFGIPWLVWRPLFGLEWVSAPRRIETVDVARAVGKSLPLTTKCKLESRIPFNQILELAIEEVELPVDGLPDALDGYRIAHLSDIHLTGDIRLDFAAYAVRRATEWKPDLLALTGDIIDKRPCIGWLGEIFAPAAARDGCYFVLGNHDIRIVDSRETRHAMGRAGWTDLGTRVMDIDLAGVQSSLIGNEHPWYQRPSLAESDPNRFRLLLSHSPDQFGWARQHGVKLMLAGHTHGGQGRLPLVGPILGPSYHGSRWASGDFFRPPTTMHVSRGLSGTHLLRLNCRPELSLLTLRVPCGVSSRT